MSKELARNLIEAGVHFGHAASRWNPKMKPYIFAKRGMVHIIDVKQTIKGLLIAKKLLTQVVASGKDVVFVGTKRQAQKAVETVAVETGMHYVGHRWLGGTLTNFQTIRTRVKRMEELEAMVMDGSIEAESKKRASMLKREMNKIKENLDGLRKMNRMPGAVVVVDTSKEKNALREARKLGIFTIGVIDTNSDPDMVDVAIPANDDSLKAIDIITKELAAAVAAGKTVQRATAAAAAAAPKAAPARSRRRASEVSEEAQQLADVEAKQAQEAPAAEEAETTGDAQ